MNDVKERPRRIQYELKPRMLTVRHVEYRSSRFIRVTFESDDLVDFQTHSPTDHVKLVFPSPGSGEPTMPRLGPNGMIPPLPEEQKPITRDFSIRTFRPDIREVDIEFVIHGDGVASTWATNAAPGQRLGMLGPRGSRLVPEHDGWFLLAGDETALPAVGRWLEEAVPDQRIYVVLEIDGTDDEQELSSRADVSLVWVHRNGAEPGTTTLLESTIRALNLDAYDGYAWVAGEAGTLKTIRRYLRNELGMAPERVEVDGYWRRGTVNFDHHTPIEE